VANVEEVRLAARGAIDMVDGAAKAIEQTRDTVTDARGAVEQSTHDSTHPHVRIAVDLLAAAEAEADDASTLLIEGAERTRAYLTSLG
jgi:hypothetical protein